MAVVPRIPYLVDVGNNKVVQLNIKKESYTGDLATDLGYTLLGETGEIPAGKTLVGKGRLAAMQNGCFPISLVYAFDSKTLRVAKVLCSPTKSDSIFVDAKTDTYRGKNIVEVRVPKRRIYAY